MRLVGAWTLAARVDPEMIEYDAKAKVLPIPQRDMSSPYGPPVEGLEVIEIK